MKNTFLRSAMPVVAMGLAVCLIGLPSCGKQQKSNDSAKGSAEGQEQLAEYRVIQGNTFGTYYEIRYDSDVDLQDKITQRLADLDNSLSSFNQNSLIQQINRNETAETDAYFERMFEVAEQTSIASDGAFDITVAPLIKAWSEAFDRDETLTEDEVNELKQYVGFANLELRGHRLSKYHPDIQVNASALVKGLADDLIADILRDAGCENYYIDLGGKIECQGVAENGKPWLVDITVPSEDPTSASKDVVATIQTQHLCLATSGSSRRYMKDGKVHKSHTIDPATGYPVDHNLLSVVVVAPTGIQADALATACMVMGKDKSIQVMNGLKGTDCYITYLDKDGKRVVAMSDGMQELLK